MSRKKAEEDGSGENSLSLSSGTEGTHANLTPVVDEAQLLADVRSLILAARGDKWNAPDEAMRGRLPE